MTELITGEPCTLWERSKVKAQDRGLTLSDNCPNSDYCDGHRCIFLENPSKEEVKLLQLRQELKDLSNGKIN